MKWFAAVFLFLQLLHVQSCFNPCGELADCFKTSDFGIATMCANTQASYSKCICGTGFTCRTNTDVQLSYGGTCELNDGLIATIVIIGLLVCCSPFICCYMGCSFCANCCCYRPPTVINTPAAAPAVVMVQQPQTQTAQMQPQAPQFQQQPQAPAPSPAPQYYSQPAAALPQWMYLDQNNQPQGPVDQSVLAGWLKAGQVPSSIQVCQVGGQQYAQATTFPALVPPVHNLPAPAGVQPVNQSQVQVQLPQGSAEYHGMPAPAQPLPTFPPE
jgi:hypothetical protein